MEGNAHVFDATLASFEQDAILKSKEVPVLVDFWAAWCGPCKSLGPVLEKLAQEYAGGFLLAKVDVDKEQQLAGYFQIKSIPTVMLLKDGQIVDGFPGRCRKGRCASSCSTTASSPWRRTKKRRRKRRRKNPIPTPTCSGSGPRRRPNRNATSSSSSLPTCGT